MMYLENDDNNNKYPLLKLLAISGFACFFAWCFFCVKGFAYDLSFGGYNFNGFDDNNIEVIEDFYCNVWLNDSDNRSDSEKLSILLLELKDKGYSQEYINQFKTEEEYITVPKRMLSSSGVQSAQDIFFSQFDFGDMFRFDSGSVTSMYRFDSINSDKVLPYVVVGVGNFKNKWGNSQKPLITKKYSYVRDMGDFQILFMSYKNFKTWAIDSGYNSQELLLNNVTADSNYFMIDLAEFKQVFNNTIVWIDSEKNVLGTSIYDENAIYQTPTPMPLVIEPTLTATPTATPTPWPWEEETTPTPSNTPIAGGSSFDSGDLSGLQKSIEDLKTIEEEHFRLDSEQITNENATIFEKPLNKYNTSETILIVVIALAFVFGFGFLIMHFIPHNR